MEKKLIKNQMEGVEVLLIYFLRKDQKHLKK